MKIINAYIPCTSKCFLLLSNHKKKVNILLSISLTKRCHTTLMNLKEMDKVQIVVHFEFLKRVMLFLCANMATY